MQPLESQPPPAPLSFRKASLLWLLLLLPLGLEIYGFNKGHLLQVHTWAPDGRLRFDRYAIFCGAAILLFGLFARRYFPLVVAAALVLCSAFAVGVVPVATVLVFVFSSTVLGRSLFGETIEGTLAFLGGAAFLIFAMYLTLHLPIHYPATHLAALTLPVVIRYRCSRDLAAQWIDLLHPAKSCGIAEFAPSAGLAFVTRGKLADRPQAGS